MPYPLPAGGPPYSEDLRWFLVAVPDDVAFVRAAMGAYTEFTKYWVWGHEGKEPGRNEAAQVWEGAVAATLEALEMGFPDILLGYIDDVEDLLSALQGNTGCCPVSDILDIVPDAVDLIGPVIDTSGADVQVGVGDPPGGVEDWNTYSSRLCDAASKYADGLVDAVDNFQLIQGVLQGLTLGAVGALLATLLPLLGVTVVAAGVVVSALSLLGVLDELHDLVEPASGWDQMRADILSVRDDIVCAIILSGTPAEAAAAVQAVVEGVNPDAWDWVRLLTVPTAVMQRIFNMGSDAAGGYGGGCLDCEEDAFWEHTYTFNDNDNSPPWGFVRRIFWNTSYDSLWFVPKSSMDNSLANLELDDLGNPPINPAADYVPVGPWTLDIVPYEGNTENPFTEGKSMRVTVFYKDASSSVTNITDFGTAIPITINPAKVLEINNTSVRLEAFHGGSNSENYWYVDNVRLRVNPA